MRKTCFARTAKSNEMLSFKDRRSTASSRTPALFQKSCPPDKKNTQKDAQNERKIRARETEARTPASNSADAPEMLS